MEPPNVREQHLQADADSVRADYGRVRNALDTAVRLKLKAQDERDLLRAVNAKLLSALERTVSDLEDVIRIVRVDKGVRGEWPRAEKGLIQAREAVEEARK